MDNQNDVVDYIVEPFEDLMNAWTNARDHVEKIIKENPDPKLIHQAEKLNERIDILNNLIKEFRDEYSVKDT